MMRNSSLSVALRRGLQVAALGAGLLALAACGDQPEAESPEALARAVTVVPVANRSLTGSLSAARPLVPREAAALTPAV
ncbi:MAG TPA: efflux RND transporter periplasmic adaptor subunit, partial [Phenylobacterium sp.]|nr:efflux RND transporter periplasmic adaptor subunit [Phenylobacterium sp.]